MRAVPEMHQLNLYTWQPQGIYLLYMSATNDLHVDHHHDAGPGTKSQRACMRHPEHACTIKATSRRYRFTYHNSQCAPMSGVLHPVQDIGGTGRSARVFLLQVVGHKWHGSRRPHLHVCRRVGLRMHSKSLSQHKSGSLAVVAEYNGL